MALKEYLVLPLLASLLIGWPSSLAWNTNTRRSYDLEQGPVFYEAYYLDSNEEQRSNYQEKRYLDRDAVLERSYQLPPESLDYQRENAARSNEYQNLPEKLSPTPNYREQRGMPDNVMRDRMSDFHSEGLPARTIDPDKRYNPFPGASTNSLGNGPSLGIKEISSIARRAISRDLENWSMIENYLDRAAKYQDQPGSYPSRQNPIAESREERTELKTVQPITRQRDQPVLSNRAVPNTNSFESYEANRYDDRRLTDWQSESRPEPLVRAQSQFTNQPIRAAQEPTTLNSYPPENIFEPRPQVIKYVFSKKAKAGAKAQVKEPPKETVPRNYGDNLIRDEVKKSDDPGNIKITSIEVSEVPRHKTRHHHGEWPRRDYSHRH